MSSENKDQSEPKPLRNLSRRRALVLGAAGLVATGAKRVRGDDWLTHRSWRHRTVCLPGVPDADYHSRKRTVSFFAASQSANVRGKVSSIDEKIANVYRSASIKHAATLPRLRAADETLPTPQAVQESAPSAPNPALPTRIAPNFTGAGAHVKSFVLERVSVGQSPFSLQGFTLTIDEELNWSVALEAHYKATDDRNRPIAELTNDRHEFQVIVRLYPSRPVGSGASAVLPTNGSANTSLVTGFPATGHLAEINLDSFWVPRDTPTRMLFGAAGNPRHRDIFHLAQFAEVEFFVYLDVFSGKNTKTLQGRTLR